MKEVSLIIYQVMDKLSLLSPQFDHTSWLNIDNSLSFSGGKGDTKYFLKNGKS